jgi:hypothetical protein
VKLGHTACQTIVSSEMILVVVVVVVLVEVQDSEDSSQK